jgi:bacillithiol biosynthesis deacetylase BshB1
MIDILAFGAHPDDVELAAGGTLCRHTAAGNKVVIADLTRGELGTRGDASRRETEANKAAQILGVQQRVNLGLADGFFEADENSLKRLVEVIREFRPRVVLGNAVYDRHPDHGRAAGLISRACFLSGLRKIRTHANGTEQEAWRPASVYHFIQDRFIKPDLVVDISETFTQKMQSIMAFQSQFYNPESQEPETPISSKEFLQYIESRAREMGRLIGVEFGEGFTTERPVGVGNLMILS